MTFIVSIYTLTSFPIR